ncbi:MAG: hypothetical protein NPINA01_09550 [Nitrospinaceae bacterium]|nr:MAG: hypothetical protein NPINA01_09550 [Nitrospinaceae bacterium]
MKLPSVQWIVLIVGLAFSHIESHAGSLSTLKDDGPRLRVENTQAGNHRVKLWSQGRTLEDVLQEVHERSGIEFHLPEALRDDPVPVDIQASDWTSATLQVTREYSRIEIWSNDPQNSKVWILDRNPMYSLFDPTDAFPSEVVENKIEPEFHLENAKKQSEPESILDSLPQELLSEPALWVYLQSLGIPLPDEARELFGANLNDTSLKMAIPSHILNNPKLKYYLDSIGVKTDPRTATN